MFFCVDGAVLLHFGCWFSAFGAWNFAVTSNFAVSSEAAG